MSAKKRTAQCGHTHETLSGFWGCEGRVWALYHRAPLICDFASRFHIFLACRSCWGVGASFVLEEFYHSAQVSPRFVMLIC